MRHNLWHLKWGLGKKKFGLKLYGLTRTPLTKWGTKFIYLEGWELKSESEYPEKENNHLVNFWFEPTIIYPRNIIS